MPGERRSRLERMTRPLTPTRGPYYRWTSAPPSEPAAGWYMVPKGESYPLFLGANSFDAEMKVREMLERKREGDALAKA